MLPQKAVLRVLAPVCASLGRYQVASSDKWQAPLSRRTDCGATQASYFKTPLEFVRKRVEHEVNDPTTCSPRRDSRPHRIAHRHECPAAQFLHEFLLHAKKDSYVPGLRSYRGYRMKTGEVITQRIWSVCTDFLQEIGVVKKTPMAGTQMLVTHREAVQMLVAEREKELAVLRLELLDTCLCAHINTNTDIGDTGTRMLMWIREIVFMDKPALRARLQEMGLSPEMAREI